MELRAVSFGYGGDAVLRDVDLRIARGEHAAIVGPNGAGKSTALHAILGLTPYEGALSVLGRDPWNERDLLLREFSKAA